MTVRELSEDEAHSYLIDESGDLSPIFVTVLKEIFKSFDHDSKGALTDNEIIEFSKKCNDGDGFTKENVEEIKSFFTCDNKGCLTEVTKKFGLIRVNWCRLFFFFFFCCCCCRKGFLKCTIPKQEQIH